MEADSVASRMTAGLEEFAAALEQRSTPTSGRYCCFLEQGEPCGADAMWEVGKFELPYNSTDACDDHLGYLADNGDVVFYIGPKDEATPPTR